MSCKRPGPSHIMSLYVGPEQYYNKMQSSLNIENSEFDVNPITNFLFALKVPETVYVLLTNPYR